MHRSGTSCVGNLLTKLGIYFGDESISTGSGEQNPKGFFERRDIREVCDAILHGSGTDWWAPSDFSPDRVPGKVRDEVAASFGAVLQELEQHKPWFIKEPRLCLVWPLLNRFVEAPVYVHVWRQPLEVARSLATRNGFSIDLGLALWETYIKSACQATQGQPSVLVSYNELIHDPTGVANRLFDDLRAAGVEGIRPPDRNAVHDAVDTYLYRERQSSGELDEFVTPTHARIVAKLSMGDLSDAIFREPASVTSRWRIDEWIRREGAITALRSEAVDAKRAKAELQKIRREAQRRGQASEATETLIKAMNLELQETNRALVGLEEKELMVDALNEQFRRTTLILQHSRAKTLKALVSGIRAFFRPDYNYPRPRIGFFLHYLIVRRRKDAYDLARIAASGFFDPAYYLQNNKDLDVGADPLIHFVDRGAAEGRDPSAFFDVRAYLEQHPSLASGAQALLHFIKVGHAAGHKGKPQVARRARLREIAGPAPTPKRIVIFTAVVGGYDKLRPPLIKPPNCDFVVFSDQPLEAGGWEVRPLNYRHNDPTRAARFVKLHPHIFFPDHDHSIWVDANITIRADLRPFFSRLTSNQPVAIFDHPERNCIYVEAQECIKRKKDSADVIRRHADRYRGEGFPERMGLWETNVIARRHNDPACVTLMNAWWREMEIGSRRDQLSLPVVAHRMHLQIASLGDPGQSARDHPWLTLVKHSSERRGPGGTPPVFVRKEVDLDAISIDIGVCVYNSLDEVRACLNALDAARRPQDRIIIVDDASEGRTASFLDQFAASHRRVKLVRHSENEGYTSSANDVLSASTADWVILANSDTSVPAQAMRKMIVCGEQFEQIGVVGPLSNAAGWQTVPELVGEDGKFLVNEIPPSLSVEDMDALCGEVGNAPPLFVPLVNGFFFAIRRAVIDKIGYFDEARFPVGYGEEDDYCLRANAAGFVCAIATDAYVYHVKSASFTSERRAELSAIGGKMLRKKHSAERVASATNMMKHNPELSRIREELALRLSEPQRTLTGTG